MAVTDKKALASQSDNMVFIQMTGPRGCGGTRRPFKLKFIYDSQSASLSWRHAPIWDPRPISLSL
jgi:hypothetical protein